MNKIVSYIKDLQIRMCKYILRAFQPFARNVQLLLLPDKMDNRVIHDIVALSIHIKVVIIGAIIIIIMKGLQLK